MEKLPICYVDLDDVMCNYTKAFSNKITDKIQYPQSQYGFFRNLEPIENAITAFKQLENYYDMWILSRPSIKNPLCYTEKREWVENHLGIHICEKLILSPNKTLLKGKYLIDDNIHEGFEGKLLHFGKGNEFPDWNSIITYLIK